MNSKVVVVGNSVALRVRPIVSPVMNYSQILKGVGFEVRNLAFGRATINEINAVTDEYVREYGDIYILNIGAVDAPNREVPLWYSNVLRSNSNSFYYHVLSLLYNRIFKKNRRLFTFLRFKRPWVSKSNFIKNYDEIVRKLKKDTDGAIIVLGINRGNERIERELPGTVQNYKAYNDALRDYALSNQLTFIDVSDLNSKDHYPDGVHYSELGHRVVADRINLVIGDRNKK